MPFFPPSDNVHKVLNLQRWERDWINSHDSLNFSGLVREVVDQIIEENDPIYFEQHKKFIIQRQTRRRENLTYYLKPKLEKVMPTH